MFTSKWQTSLKLVPSTSLAIVPVKTSEHKHRPGMAQQPGLSHLTSLYSGAKQPDPRTDLNKPSRPVVVHSLSEPTPNSNACLRCEAGSEDALTDGHHEFRNAATLSTISQAPHVHIAGRRESHCACEELSTPERLLPLQLDSASSKVSSILQTAQTIARGRLTGGWKRWLRLNRLKSSTRSAPTDAYPTKRLVVQSADFELCPEVLEKRFVNAPGVGLPGVYDCDQCAYPWVHFVSAFHLCEPSEYTTALADHGLTYADYCRLIAALRDFLEDIDVSPRPSKNDNQLLGLRSQAAELSVGELDEVTSRSWLRWRDLFFDTTEQLKKTKQQAAALNKLLEEISWDMQTRGVPVMVCVGSFSLFAPYRISEAYIQILHVPLERFVRGISDCPQVSEPTFTGARTGERLSFIDPGLLARPEQKTFRPRLKRQTVSATATMAMTMNETNHLTQEQPRFHDHSRLWPHWSNVVLLNKRLMRSADANPSGLNSHVQPWMKSNIRGKTKTAPLAPYIAGREHDACVDIKLEYVDSVSRGNTLLDVLTGGNRASRLQSSGRTNKARYYHNRKSECRRTAEHGARLRIIRFGFRYSILPPHTPELEALGLTKDEYQLITSNFADIDKSQCKIKCPITGLVLSLRRIRRRSAADTLTRLEEFVRKLNSQQRRIVWTIEKIPAVYDKGLVRDRTEWEISAWNSEDPLELLVQLEKWGLVEKRLSLEDDVMVTDLM